MAFVTAFDDVPPVSFVKWDSTYPYPYPYPYPNP